MPLEIFSSFVLWLEPLEVVNLESICKPWKDFASSQPVWQVKLPKKMLKYIRELINVIYMIAYIHVSLK